MVKTEYKQCKTETKKHIRWALKELLRQNKNKNAIPVCYEDDGIKINIEIKNENL